MKYLDEREFRLARLLVEEVVVVLGRDVEGVALLGVELRRVQHHRDLPLQDHEDLKQEENGHIERWHSVMFKAKTLNR